jgi:hypothetical protein
MHYTIANFWDAIAIVILGTLTSGVLFILAGIICWLIDTIHAEKPR